MTNSSMQSAAGKVILFGEHAVVYGVKALAAGIPKAITARAVLGVEQSRLEIANWGIEREIDLSSRENGEGDAIDQVLRLIFQELALPNEPFHLSIDASIPVASGLGGSAALAVASIRAIAHAFGKAITDVDTNALAYRCERIAHGAPSGVDNTLATYGGVLSFQRLDSTTNIEHISIAEPITLVVAMSGKRGYTAGAVARVRELREQQRDRIDALFERIDDIRNLGERALQSANYAALGECFDRNQACLRELSVSCDEIEQVIDAARQHGCHGAKLTGSGDGGAVLIAPSGDPHALVEALKCAGIDAFSLTIGTKLEA